MRAEQRRALLDRPHPLPIAALDGKVGVLGITGSGKTYTAIGLIEILLAMGRQVIIIDPTGAYHGLRTQFPIYIFGGPNGDMQITESDGPAVARAIVELEMSVILDVSLLLKHSHGSARRFMAGLVATLKNSPPAARYVVVDEADEFMPENASGAAAGLMGDFKWMVRRGRKDGWRVMMVTQRPADIAKSVLTQCETLVIHKLTSPQDRKALQEWVKGNAEPDQAKLVFDSLARLATGEAWIWSTSHDILERVQLPGNQSFDGSKTPEAGDELVSKRNFQQVDIARVAEIIGLPAASEESTVLADPALKAENKRLVARVAELEDTLLVTGQTADVLWSAVRLAREGLKSVGVAMEGKIATLASPALNERSAVPAAERAGASNIVPSKAPDRPAEPAPAAIPPSAPVSPAGPPITMHADSADAPKGRAAEVLRMLAETMDQHPKMRENGVKETTWAFLTGTNPKTSTWRGYKAALRPFFAQNGNRCLLTPAGEALFDFSGGGPRAGIDVGPDLVRMFIANVKPAGSAAILGYLLEIWPRSAGRSDLAAASQSEQGSSTFRGYLAPLNKLELIEKDGDGYRVARDLMEW